MCSIHELIKESRNWAAVDRGSTLLSKVSRMLQRTFGVDTGMFVYRKQFLPCGSDSDSQVYEPWGVKYSARELTQMFRDESWFTDESCVIPEGWVPISETPAVLREVWSRVGIQYVGVWQLIIQNKSAGVIIVGRKHAPDGDQEELMSALATYVSLILEMLMMRRIAEHESHYDSLTQILNRRGFNAQVLQLAQRPDDVFVIGVLDINDFKGINDNYGHASGDSVLVDAADILRKNIGSKGIYGRCGGDEFVFVLTDNQCVMNGPDSYFTDWFNAKPYTVSVGCALWEPHKTDWESCFHIADQRLYKQKRRQAVSIQQIL